MTEQPNKWMALFDEVRNPRPPKKGDRLLRQSHDPELAAEFADTAIARHVHLWDGYMRAGEALIGVCEEERAQRHDLIYPILFNYRHAVELAMKWVIERYGRYSAVNVSGSTHHNLWKLWCLCKEIIIEVGSDCDEISYVEQLIKEFHDIDKSGQTFRYAQRKDGEFSGLPDGPVDLLNVRDVMKGVGLFFIGVDGQLDAHSSAQDQCG